jgi:tetratricopeptide (TPR) repeat protein
VALVREFWRFLRSNGVDARLDQGVAGRRQDWPMWIRREMRAADFVVVVASPEYKAAAEGELGSEAEHGRGVRWESLQLVEQCYRSHQEALARIVPVVLPGSSPRDIPDFLRPASTTWYPVPELTVGGADALLRLLFGRDLTAVPPLGPVPDLPADLPSAAATVALPPRFVHGVALPSNWADREEDLAAVQARLSDSDTRVLNIVALGGTGKTMLMRKVADAQAAPESSFDAMIWFSFYRDDDVEQFFLAACRYLVPGFNPGEYTSTFERAALLQERVEGRAVLFVLDGFERLVSARRGPAVGAIDRAEMVSFLSFLVSARTRTTVVLTSRVRLDDFVGTAGYREYELPDLRQPAAITFLRRGGLVASDRVLNRIATAYGCHALTLSVFLDYAHHRGVAAELGEARIPDLPLTFPPESTRSERLGRLLADYSRRLAEPDRQVLRLIAASPRGLQHSELRLLTRQDATMPALTASALAGPHDDGGTVRYDSHPLIKSFFYDQLDPAARTAAHADLLALAQRKHVPGQPATVAEITPLLDVFWHAVAMDDVQRAFQVWRDDRVHRALLWWGNYAVALDLVDRLLAAPALRVEAKAARSKGLLLDEAGILLVKLGRPREALESYQAATKLPDLDSEALLKILLHQSEAQMETGLYLDAQDTLSRVTDLASVVSGLERYKLVGRQGYLATGLSPYAAAEALLTEAIEDAELSERSAPGYRCLFLRVRADLRLAHDRLELAEADYLAALDLATDARWHFVDYEGHVRRGLGQLAAHRGQTELAREHFGAALDIARRIGYRWLEAETSVARARAALAHGEIEVVESCLRHAAALATDGGWLALEAETLLIEARLTIMNHADPADLLDRARPLVAQCGRRSLLAEFAAVAEEPP